MTSSHKKLLKKVIQFLIILIIFYFLIKSLVVNWNQVKDYHWELNWGWVILSFLIQGLTFVILVEAWRKLLTNFGHTLSFQKIFKAWFVSNLGKYLPGKIWQILGAVYLLEKEGVPKRKTMAVAIMAQAFSIFSGIFLSLIFLGYDFYEKYLAQSKVLLGVIVIFMVGMLALILYPKFLEKVLNGLLRLAKKEPIEIKLKAKDMLLYLWLYGVSWMIFGLGFMVLIKAMTPVSFNQYFGLSGAFAFSYILGLLALFAPGGIGVREGILVILLSNFFPTPVATLISFSSRIWITLAEALCFGLTFAIKGPE
jgi:uncharacterized membrane protein YbhN (UPF0104 family)